ncbi:MAG: nucleic acid-binding protein [Bacteroidetes bacterium QH_10_64_19]|nr:MAG: nucleic acid-binding protein [Bacteroidetes bacterium QH_10_64_19]PSQ76709.1 MAG: nucleic acid-binding protein [Bacteroidetes bacterium QH_6_63_17]
MSLFVDTWGWLALRDRRESRHEEVRAYFQEALQDPGLIYTTDYVLTETLTLLFKRLPFSNAWEGYQRIESARRNDFLNVVWIGRERFDQAIAFRRRYSDKPDISFTDLTSMVVMQELELRDVLTGDAHFEHVGMGFRRQP